MYIIFETPHLILRRITEADASLILALNSDPAVLKYLHEPVLQNEEHAREIIRNIILPQYENNLGRWAIITKGNNEFIGWCGLKHRPELEEIDLGYRLKPTVWGNGFATEAAAATLDHGFKKLHLSIITGRAHVENIASLKVLEKIGMTFIKEEVVDDCPVKTFVATAPSISPRGGGNALDQSKD
jgi:RimJ/RimL family protein N-acetyltransferase